MHPDLQRGFALVSAIFILVVLAALGGFIATVSTTQHTASALDVMGAQAYQAARAGTEWGLSQVFTAHACPTTNLTFTVDGMTVTVKCDDSVTGVSYEKPTLVGRHIYQITAIACNMPDPVCPSTGTTSAPNYVERAMSVTAEMP